MSRKFLAITDGLLFVVPTFSHTIFLEYLSIYIYYIIRQHMLKSQYTYNNINICNMVCACIYKLPIDAAMNWKSIWLKLIEAIYKPDMVWAL